MQMSDTRQIAAPPASVWAALFDAETLKACVPGCTELTGSASEGYEATVVQKVGPVKATFKGTVTISDVVAGESCTLTGEGKGGAAGFAKGEAKVRLDPAEGGTLLSYEVDAKVGGKLAQLGSRIVDGFARRMAADFFTRFQAELEGPEADAAAPKTAPEAESSPPTPEKKGWIKRVFG
ncbi:CoxG family protein [Natronohydrobacter thiooxidans]|uniref:CoxG family protein n=1 Tax=Natronohydrobacter thiooxidans TaxID=87172 RepID=UPI0008FF2BCB|nr:carbon monoxide dehydrogenase subunit G [Natronohydrobacter thiooxidans]